MFDTLSDRLSATFRTLRGKGRLSDADIDETLREIRIALLEADVSLVVVKDFVAAIRERAKAEDLSKSLNPAQQIVKIVNDELVTILGGETVLGKGSVVGGSVFLTKSVPAASRVAVKPPELRVQGPAVGEDVE